MRSREVTAASGAPDFILRPAAPADRESFRAIHHEMRAPDFAQLPPEMRARILDMQFDIYEGGCLGAEVLAVESGGAVVGRLVLRPEDDGLRVIDLALAVAVRGLGLGTALLRRLQDQGRTITLSVRPFNPARRLYARLGFAEISDNQVSVEMLWRPERPAAPPANETPR